MRMRRSVEVTFRGGFFERALEMTERAYRVALRAKRGILVREGAELSSDEVGELAAGTVVSGSIHPTRSSDGRLRVRLLSPLVGFASLSLLDEVRDEQRQRPQSAETLPKLDARTGMLMGMLPALLAAHRQFTTGGSCFYVGVVTDASGQKYEIYCSPGGVDCLGEEKKQPTRAVSTAAARLMAELPFYDFGFVAWPPSALRESVRPLVPRVPSQASEPPVYFVHPFASIVNELDADEPCHDEIPRDELGTSAARVAARYGELWGANWIIPPYFALRDAGHNVHLASRVVPGHINVVHSYSSGYVGDPARLARVCSAPSSRSRTTVPLRASSRLASTASCRTSFKRAVTIAHPCLAVTVARPSLASPAERTRCPCSHSNAYGDGAPAERTWFGVSFSWVIATSSIPH